MIIETRRKGMFEVQEYYKVINVGVSRALVARAMCAAIFEMTRAMILRTAQCDINWCVLVLLYSSRHDIEENTAIDS